jgi:hypothetical protein
MRTVDARLADQEPVASPEQWASALAADVVAGLVSASGSPWSLVLVWLGLECVRGLDYHVSAMVLRGLEGRARALLRHSQVGGFGGDELMVSLLAAAAICGLRDALPDLGPDAEALESMLVDGLRDTVMDRDVGVRWGAASPQDVARLLDAVPSPLEPILPLLTLALIALSARHEVPEPAWLRAAVGAT